MACHQIWHLKWKNVQERPRPRVGRDIQMRGLDKKRRRRAIAPGADADEEEVEKAKEEADDGAALASAAKE
ncbi:hypothetical protein PI124_g21389 [Phytophthora idaei]|nr:hypothetical protein PI125_g20170 [Phytophthora idaei]KAG3233538.1 hypothetical protein PI124_g21389 [Phytophthora idaei]